MFLKLSGDTQGDPKGPVFWAFRPHPEPLTIGDDRFLQLCTKSGSSSSNNNNDNKSPDSGGGCSGDGSSNGPGSRGREEEGGGGGDGAGSSSSRDREGLQEWQGEHVGDNARPVELYMDELWEVGSVLSGFGNRLPRCKQKWVLFV